MRIRMRRRSLVASLPVGVAVAVGPGLLRAQPAAVPVVGLLNNRTAEQGRYLVAAIREGLKQTGFVDGENVTLVFAWSGGDISQLPALAQSLVRRPVAVIIAGGTVQPAKAATTTIPVVFTTGQDPVAYGVVTNLGRPEGNVTGVTFYSGALLGKQLELLREVAPQAATIGLLVKPDSPSAAPQIAALREAAQASGVSIEVVNAALEADFEPAIAGFARRPGAAMMVSVDPYFDSRADRLVALARRHALPTVYNLREYVAAGGLISYGASIVDAYRQAGAYAGRILKGARPSDLPVVLPTQFELVVNRTAATALGLTLPRSILARADEVIE
jgi:putative ABC transport system substrate-binding protein